MDSVRSHFEMMNPLTSWTPAVLVPQIEEESVHLVRGTSFQSDLLQNHTLIDKLFIENLPLAVLFAPNTKIKQVMHTIKPSPIGNKRLAKPA